MAAAARRGGRFRAAPRDILLVAASGVLLALHFATWITSLEFTTVGSSVLLVSTQPLFGLALSRLVLKETASPRTVAAILVSLAGTAVIAWGDLSLGPRVLIGDLLALSGAAFAAGYLLIGRGLRARVPFGSYLLRVYATAALVLGAAAFLGGAAGRAEVAEDWPWLLLMAAGPGVAGHGLLNWCVRRTRAYVVNAALLGEPILATLYAALIFGERPGPHLVFGGILVVFGLGWTLREEGGEAPAPGSL